MRKFMPIALIGPAVCITVSCLEGADIAIYDCLNPVLEHLNAQGYQDPCCLDKTRPCHPDTPAPPKAPECDGNCKPFGSPPDWYPTPVLLWHGSPTAPFPGCPWDGMTSGRLGRDPIVPNTCPQCTCGEPACLLPDGLIVSSAPGCISGPFTAFPADPEKSCSNKASFEANQLQSIALPLPTVSPCTASMVPVPKYHDGDNWSTNALVCYSNGGGLCEDIHNQACVPAAPPGFLHCVQNRTQGKLDTECPSGYPNKHVYYEEIDYEAACTPCDCSPPDNSLCVAQVTAYSGEACTSDSMFLNVVLSSSSSPPPCYSPVQPNTPLKGLREKWINNAPGHCDPIPSVPSGIAKGLEASAWEFCCADPDVPDTGP